MQDDGNLVLYDDNKDSIWATDSCTDHHDVDHHFDCIEQDGIIMAGSKLGSVNHKFHCTM